MGHSSGDDTASFPSSASTRWGATRSFFGVISSGRLEGGGGADGPGVCSGLPQLPQNVASGSLLYPHSGHFFSADTFVLPGLNCSTCAVGEQAWGHLRRALRCRHNSLACCSDGRRYGAALRSWLGSLPQASSSRPHQPSASLLRLRPLRFSRPHRIEEP